ncbi:MAG: ABC transporter ATP-binding protein [Cytophagales bacterium]|nr:MAG: ABC transporter ATP-binding protein [Cytophagales bacterium]
MASETKSKKVFDFQIIKRLLNYTKPYRFKFYALIGIIILASILGPLKPWLIQYIIDVPVREGDRILLLNATILLLILLVLHAILQYYSTFLAGWIGQHIIKDLRVKLFKHLLQMRLKFFDQNAIGRLITRNVSDIETLADVFSEGMAAIAGDILQITVILGFMLYTNWKLTLVSLSMFPLMLVATYIFKEKIKTSFNDVRIAVANLNTFVQEHISGMNIVQIFNSEEREYQKFVQINKEHRTANLKSVLYYSIYFPVAEIIAAMGTGLLVWYGCTQAIDNVNLLPSEVTVGTIISFVMYLAMFFRPIRMIADRFNTLQMGIVSTGRVLDLLDNQEDIMNEGNYQQSINGEVKFDKVWFAYNGEDFVLKDISFDVPKGQMLAIVGATGAGKSSIVNLLNRFYEINKGSIKVDGVDVKDFQLHSLRNGIGVVLQDVFLFSDTIFNNITLYHPEISESKVWETAELVGARAFIERLPGGLHYNVMERGNTLSVGQRQLISFIRAIVFDPKIIVLDEATSSVDSETENMIQNAIEFLMKGRTSIVIAHRLSTIQKADKILVMEKGEIIETGTHEELLSKKGYYFDLVNVQFKSNF